MWLKDCSTLNNLGLCDLNGLFQDKRTKSELDAEALTRGLKFTVQSRMFPVRMAVQVHSFTLDHLPRGFVLPATVGMEVTRLITASALH